MLLLSMVVLSVFIIHAISELILGMSLVVVMMVTVFIFPSDFLVMTLHRPRKVMKRMRVTMST